MPLFNVRLAAEDARLVRGLRASGVSLSEVVRLAIRNEARKRLSATRPVAVATLLAEMVAAHPAPSGKSTPKRPTGVGRRELQRVVPEKLQGRR